MNYFEMFPEIDYNGTKTRDITRRAILTSTYRNNPRVFLPYTIRDGEKAYQIAHHYYGSVEWTWLVWMSNQVIDPYYEWPLFGSDFDTHLIKKYSEKSGKTGMDVVNWTLDETTDDNIVYFQNREYPDIRVSSSTRLSPTFVSSEWQAVRIFQDEYDRNEIRRNISLVDLSYAKSVEQQLKKVIN